MSKTTIKITASTNMGLVRTNNEDNFIVSPNLEKNEWMLSNPGEYHELGKYGALIVVADGMGGANAGEVASEIAVETVKSMCTPEELEKLDYSDANIAEFMTKLVNQADLNIEARGKEDDSTKGMGTTIVMAWIYNNVAHICWCGDSRCYVYNSNVGLQRLSKDHSYVQDLVDKGDLDPENAFDHPYSNVITRCLSDSDTKAEPDCRTYNLVDGDILLLCTDGLSGLCRDEETMEILTRHGDDVVACNSNLIEAALNAGGHDNVTSALCAVKIEETEDDKKEIVSTITLNKSKGSWLKWLLFILILIAIVAAVLVYTNVLPLAI